MRAAIDTRGKRGLIRLLGRLQDHLESAIECTLLEGERQPREKWLRPLVARDRREWREAEEYVKRLSEMVAREERTLRKVTRRRAS